MDRIFGQMSPPLMEGWTSEMSFRPYEAKSCRRKEHQLPRSCDLAYTEHGAVVRGGVVQVVHQA